MRSNQEITTYPPIIGCNTSPAAIVLLCALAAGHTLLSYGRLIEGYLAILEIFSQGTLMIGYLLNDACPI
jgi:hypothetical protein